MLGESSCFAMFLISMIIIVHCFGSTEIGNPFLMGNDDTVSSLYQWTKDQVEEPDNRGISIVFNHSIILDLNDDHRLLSDIGMNSAVNNILLIQKPKFVALLEMVHGISNFWNIPWHNEAMQCLSESSANQCPFEKVSQFGAGLECDAEGDLIEVDLSHLNLTGTIHLGSLPQKVRSLDLSFNDLDCLNIEELRGKSLERLNVENNIRCHINTEYFSGKSRNNLILKELQLSSNQIFPWISSFGEKMLKIKRWLLLQSTLNELILDGMSMRTWSELTGDVRDVRMDLSRKNEQNHDQEGLFMTQMLRVFEGVINKEVIPCYRYFVFGTHLPASEWNRLGVGCCRGRVGRWGIKVPNRFNLSGLGLEGHIDLGSLPQNISTMNLSNNNLSSISFHGRGPFGLRTLNIQNNDNLRIDWMQLDVFTPSSALCGLKRFDISSNQLEIKGFDEELSLGAKHAIVKRWLSTTALYGIVVDDKAYVTRNCSIHKELETGRVISIETVLPVLVPVLGRVISMGQNVRQYHEKQTTFCVELASV